MGCKALVQDLESCITGILGGCRTGACCCKATADKHHFLVELKDKVTLKTTPEKMSTKKVVEKLVAGESESSTKFNDIFLYYYSTPLKKVHKKSKEELSSHVSGLPQKQ